MKKVRVIVGLLFIASVFTGCQSGNKSKEVASYQYEGGSTKLNEKLETKVGSWIKEGVECYGLVVWNEKDGRIINVKEVKAKVMTIQSDKIKMKALETVSLAPKKGCGKFGLEKNDIWWEEDGELFQTREEAVAFINDNMKVSKVKSKKATVD